ncbi:MAG: site-2 protease family protein [Planctomycetota bacterium]
MDFLDAILKIFLVVLGLGFIIFVHELGHFLVARWCGVRAHSFSFGMGPILFGYTPKYPWRPGAKNFRYNDVLGPDLITDRDGLEIMLVGPEARDPGRRESMLAGLPNARYGHRRLRMLEWPVAQLEAGMVLATLQRDNGKTKVGAELITDERLAELKASGSTKELIYDAGETEYRLSLLPLGGYVGMAGGEVPGEGIQQNLPDEFLNKGPGARAAILSAGVIMNAISAVLMFMVAYAIGVDSPPAVVGSVEATASTTMTDADGKKVLDTSAPGPAWMAGLRDGDRIVKIVVYKDGTTPPEDDGTVDPNIDFTELRIAAAFTEPGDVVRLYVLRGPEHQRHAIDVRPVYNPQMGFMSIGVGQTLTTRVEELSADARERNGDKLQRGDTVVAVNGTRLEYAWAPPAGETENLQRPWPRSFTHLKELLRKSEGTTVELGVLRNGAEITVSVELGEAPAMMPGVGLDSTPIMPVRIARPGGPAAMAVRAVQGANGELVPSDKPEDLWPLQPGDRVVQVGDVTVLSHDHMRRLVNALAADVPALFTIERKGEGDALNRVQVFMSPMQRRDDGSKFLEFIPDTRTISDDGPLEILNVEADGPAAKATFVGVKGDLPAGVTLSDDDKKIRPKDILRMVNDAPVVSWGITGSTEKPGLGDLIRAGWDGKALTAATLRLQIVRQIPADAIAGSDKPAEIAMEFEVTPTATETSRTIGFAPSQAMQTTTHFGVESIQVGLQKTWVMIQQVFLTLRSLFKGTVHAKNIGGPVMIATVSYKFAGWGLGTFIYFMAIISVNLAIINLLPIPLLDGGHLVFVGIEAIRRKPVSERIQGYATWVGLAMILSLLVFVMYNDIARLLGG